MITTCGFCVRSGDKDGADGPVETSQDRGEGSTPSLEVLTLSDLSEQ